jgi:hypothetical protein
MNELDDFLCERQSDEYEYNEDSFWFWIDEYDLGMGIEN